MKTAAFPAMPRTRFLYALGAALAAPLAASAAESYAVRYSDAQWMERLGPQRYEILRRNGTEPAFSSAYIKETRPGTYRCAGCDLALFSSAAKYDSGDGWPSFRSVLPNAVRTRADFELIEPRTEVHCRQCGGHLGHLFDDGPPPAHRRYCIDGLALRLDMGKKS